MRSSTKNTDIAFIAPRAPGMLVPDEERRIDTGEDFPAPPLPRSRYAVDLSRKEQARDRFRFQRRP